MVEGLENGVVTDGRETGEIKKSSDWGTPSCDAALFFLLAAVVVEWCHTGEFCDGCPAQGAQFRHVTQQSN